MYLAESIWLMLDAHKQTTKNPTNYAHAGMSLGNQYITKTVTYKCIVNARVIPLRIYRWVSRHFQKSISQPRCQLLKNP